MKQLSVLWGIPGRAWSALMAAPVATLSILLAAGGGMAWTVVAVGYVMWSHKRLSADQLFWIIVGAHVLVFSALIIIGRREFSASLNRQGLTMNVGAEDAPPPMTVETTTTTTVAQPERSLEDPA